MEFGKIVAFVALLSGLCVPVAQAQPDDAPQNMTVPLPKPPRVRATEPGQQITQDLMDFVEVLNGDAIFPDGLRFITGARIGYFGANEWARDIQQQRDMFRFQIDNLSVDKIEGETATATLIYHFKTLALIPDAPEAKRLAALLAGEKTETLTLKLGNFGIAPDKIWQIVPPSEEPALPKPDGGGFLSYAAYFLSQKHGVDAQLRAKPSLQNLKMLGLGALQFAQDWDEIFAFAPEYLREALLPYTKSEATFLVPGSREPYAFNSNLSEKNVAQLDEVARTVLFYEGENEKLAFRYDGKAAVGFVDGHVALVSPDDAKNLIWKP